MQNLSVGLFTFPQDGQTFPAGSAGSGSGAGTGSGAEKSCAAAASGAGSSNAGKSAGTSTAGAAGSAAGSTGAAGASIFDPQLMQKASPGLTGAPQLGHVGPPATATGTAAWTCWAARAAWMSAMGLPHPEQNRSEAPTEVPQNGHA